jgi:hypothetical protein
MRRKVSVDARTALVDVRVGVVHRLELKVVRSRRRRRQGQGRTEQQQPQPEQNNLHQFNHLSRQSTNQPVNRMTAGSKGPKHRYSHRSLLRPCTSHTSTQRTTRLRFQIERTASTTAKRVVEETTQKLMGCAELCRSW